MAPRMEPWDRRPGEGSKAFAAFAVYRDMGNARSLVRVAEELGKTPQLIARWSSHWSWVARAAAWDNEQDRIKRRAFARESLRLGERQARTGMLMQVRATTRLAKMSEADVEALTISEAIRLAVAGVRIERMARGEPPVVQAEIVPETPTRTIINLLGQHPERIGPVVDTVVKLSELLPELEAGYHPIDVTPPDDADEG